uniref:Uncharacterized protein n=1 Tax=Gorilla gorilla gorilla TaxID=9595 RepID=A0A2I2Y346_GORGO
MPTHQPFPNTETVCPFSRAYDSTLYVILPLELMGRINVWDFAVLITKLGQKSIIFGCSVCVQETFLCEHFGNFVVCFHIMFKTFEAMLARGGGSHL